MNKKHKGGASELIASAWLLNQGYEVFRNVSCHGPVDLVAFDPENRQTLLIDVKTIQPYVNKDGNQKFGYGKLTQEQNTLGVKSLLVNLTTSECFYLEEDVN